MINRNENILSGVLLIGVILLLSTAIVFYLMKESEKEKRITLQRQVDTLSIEKQNLETKLKESEIATAQAESNIKFQDEKISILNKEIEDEKTANSKYAMKIQEKELELHALKMKIEESRAQKQEAEKKLERINEDYLNMKFQLENIMRTKEELEKKAKEIAEKEGVSLGTVVVKQSRN